MTSFVLVHGAWHGSWKVPPIPAEVFGSAKAEAFSR